MMTREEAKELLIHILMTYEPKDQYGDLDDPEPYEQAVTMAIKALKDKTDGDLISRQAATSMPILPKEHRKVFRNEDDAFETGWNEALACVNELPSVCPDLSDYCDRLWKLAYERGKAEVEPKTGECSGCKCLGSYESDFPCVNCVRITKNYYCGARMKGEEE